jgi:hypothetical protein
MFFAFCTGFRHGSLLCPSSPFIHFASTEPLSLARFGYIHGSSFSVHRLPTFQLACWSLWAALHAKDANFCR